MATEYVQVTPAEGYKLVSNASDFLAVNKGSNTIDACFSDGVPAADHPTFPVHPGVAVVRNGVVGDLYSLTGTWAVS